MALCYKQMKRPPYSLWKYKKYLNYERSYGNSDVNFISKMLQKLVINDTDPIDHNFLNNRGIYIIQNRK